jgi:hypothetical protein
MVLVVLRFHYFSHLFPSVVTCHGCPSPCLSVSFPVCIVSRSHRCTVNGLGCIPYMLLSAYVGRRNELVVFEREKGSIMADNVRVAVRLRPFNKRETERDAKLVITMNKATQQTTIANPAPEPGKHLNFTSSWLC